MGNKTCELMKAGKTVLFAFEEAIGIVLHIYHWRASIQGSQWIENKV